MHLLTAQLKDTEGAVFLCGAEEILVFCKNVSEITLKSIGRHALDVLVEEAGLSANFTVFDVCKDSERLVEIYTYDHLIKENGRPGEPEMISGQFSIPRNKSGKVTKIDSRKVLVVEDDPVIRWAIRGVLKDECLLATAQDFNSAISVYHTYKPDVVFLDINLPGKSGKEVMAHILESDPGAYIVICSSHDNMDNIVEFMEGGAKGFIAKPFRKEKLLQYVHNCPH
jgi:two-component system chemotaxis response regulator CheY